MAKVTVSFVTRDDEKTLKIESDKERNRDYTGSVKTKFRYGDTAYFRVYSPEPDRIITAATDGTVSDMGIFSESVVEYVSFITENSAETEKPVKNLTDSGWLGTSLGEVSLKDAFSVHTEETPVPADGKIGLAKINYQSPYRLFGLTLSKKDMDEYPVMVYVGAENA